MERTAPGREAPRPHAGGGAGAIEPNGGAVARGKAIGREARTAEPPGAGEHQESPALAGLTVAILQTRHRKILAQLIRRAGGTPVMAPCLREVRFEDDEALRATLRRLEAQPIDLAVFQTGVGAAALHDRAAQLGLADVLAERLAGATVLARGPKPLSALLKRGVRVDLRTPEPHTTEEILTLLRGFLGSDGLSGYAVLLQHYGSPNRALVDFLAERSTTIIEAFTYSWGLPENLAPAMRCLRMLGSGAIDAAVFTSAAQVENLYLIAEQAGQAADLTGWLRRTVVAAVGPTTAGALQEHGIEPQVRPEHPKMVPLVDALCRHFAAARR